MIRGCIQKHDSKNVWKRINGQKHLNAKGIHKNEAMGIKDGKIEGTPKGIVNIKTDYLQIEFYRPNAEPMILAIPVATWAMSEQAERLQIHPKINQQR